MESQTMALLLLIAIFFSAVDATSPAPSPSFPFPWLPNAASPAPSPSFPFPWLPNAASPAPSPSFPFPWLPMPSPAYPPQPANVPSSSPSAPPPAMPISTIRAAYWPFWMSWTFPASAIETTYFTHIYYAFVLPDPNTFQININPQDGELIASFTATLHGKKPPVKALLSIGGGGDSGIAATFGQMVSSTANRAAFIDSTIAVAREYGLDGVDLDWEFPQSQDEMDNLGLLFADWRAALGKEAAATGRPRLLLTAAVYFAAEFIAADNRSYPAVSMAKNVDWVNAMCFDYHGTWDPSKTGSHAALYDPNSDLSTSFGLRSWVSAGLPSRKVVMGLPLYGRTWQLQNPAVHGVGAPAVGPGPGGGVMNFKDLMDYNVANNATVVYDGTTVSTYSYSGTAWIGYDGVKSVKKKIDYAQGLDLGGYFFWAVGYDKDWMISSRAWRAWRH